MLGGHTATISEGRVTQFGPTQDCYRAPVDLTTAQVFSDPPINAAAVEKRGGEIVLSSRRALAGGRPRGGDRRRRLHPRRCARTSSRPRRGGPGQVPLTGVVQITELSGSESVAHFAVGDQTWVAQSNGVHPYRVGETPRVLPRRRATASTSPATAGGSPDGAHRARGAAPQLRRRTRAGPADYALKEIDIDWRDGGAYALLGPSGCGKTTLLNIISGLVVPSEGRVLFDDRDVTRLAPDRAQHRPGVPVPGHLRHHDRLRQPRLPAAQPRRRAGRGRRPRPRHRRACSS